MVFGHYDQNLARIERRLNVSLNANGNHVVIKGAAEAAGHARRVLQILFERARSGQAATLGDVDGAIEECAMQGSLFPGETPAARSNFEQVATRKKGVVRARTGAQDYYIHELKQRELFSPRARPAPERRGSRSAMPCPCSNKARSSG